MGVRLRQVSQYIILIICLLCILQTEKLHMYQCLACMYRQRIDGLNVFHVYVIFFHFSNCIFKFSSVATRLVNATIHSFFIRINFIRISRLKFAKF